MGAGIQTSYGTRAASAELSPPSFPIPQTHFCLFALLPHSDGLLSNSASSVVPVANVLFCRRSFPPAKRRAGPSSIPTCLARSTRVSRQHTVRLGQLSASPYPTPSLASSCFPWPLPVAARHLPKSPCRMRHMELSRRVALDNLFPKAPLAAIPRTGSACASSRAYQQYAINSFLLPSVTPRVDSNAIHPSHDQLCSTFSHHRSWPPAGHTAASPPRLHTSPTGAPFRSNTVFIYPFPQSQPSSRFPSHLLIAYHPLHPSSRRPRSSSPIPYKVLLFCIPISSRTDFVVSQLPPLQNIVQTSWARCACSVYFIQSIVCERPESDVLLPSRALPRSLTHPNYPSTLAGGLPRFTLRTTPRLIILIFRY
jgi:hypothetical protein